MVTRRNVPRQGRRGIEGMANLPFLPKGVTKTRAGHLRYTSPASLRHRYVHRVVVERLIEETHPLTKQLLPHPFEVHHMDYNKENNAPCNLLIVSEAFHSRQTVDGAPRDGNGRWGRKFMPRWRPVPAWKLFEEFEENDDGEIPF
jgi:hypothetical protein